MIHFELGDVIATRKVRFKGADGTLVDVSVSLGKPVPDPRDPQRTRMCPYQIRGIGDERIRAIFGIDTMQALILALHILPTELAAIARETGGSFVSDEQDLGLTHACQLQMEGFGPNKTVPVDAAKGPPRG
jgi:hypothetical protein